MNLCSCTTSALALFEVLAERQPILLQWLFDREVTVFCCKYSLKCALYLKCTLMYWHCTIHCIYSTLYVCLSTESSSIRVEETLWGMGLILCRLFPSAVKLLYTLIFLHKTSVMNVSYSKCKSGEKIQIYFNSQKFHLVT